jgi:hypothetical protein
MVFSACIYLRSRFFFFLERENDSALVESKIDPSDTQHARGVGGPTKTFRGACHFNLLKSFETNRAAARQPDSK